MNAINRFCCTDVQGGVRDCDSQLEAASVNQLLYVQTPWPSLIILQVAPVGQLSPDGEQTNAQWSGFVAPGDSNTHNPSGPSVPAG